MKGVKSLNELSQITASQWGLATTAQARRFGVSRVNLSRLEENGRLERILQGVYRDTSAPSEQYERLRACWLSLYPARTAEERLKDRPYDAVVSMETAAWLLNVADFVPEPYRFSTPVRKQTQRGEIKLLRKKYRDELVIIREGLPVTRFEQTVADLMEAGIDTSLVSNMFLHCDSDTLLKLDHQLLSNLLAPLANRYGFAKNDGGGLLSMLMRPVSMSIIKTLSAAVPQILGSALSAKEWTRVIQAYEDAAASGQHHHAIPLWRQ